MATGRDGWLAAVGSLLTLMLETLRRLMACLTSPKIITYLHVLSYQDGDFGLKRTSCEMKPLGKFQWIKLTVVLLQEEILFLFYFLDIFFVKCKTRSVTVQHLAVTKLS